MTSWGLNGYRDDACNFQIDISTKKSQAGMTQEGPIPNILKRSHVILISFCRISCQCLKYWSVDESNKNKHRIEKNTLGMPHQIPLSEMSIPCAIRSKQVSQNVMLHLAAVVFGLDFHWRSSAFSLELKIINY
jgi:hypothetical protein